MGTSQAEVFSPGTVVGDYVVLGHWQEEALGQRCICERRTNMRSRERRSLLFALRDLGTACEAVHGRLRVLVERSLAFEDERIIRVADVMEFGSRLVIATPFVPGESLSRICRAAPVGIRPALAVGIAIELAKLLTSTSANSTTSTPMIRDFLAHGNITSSRVLIGHEAGRVYLGDWGLAEAMCGHAEASNHAVDPAYAAPERVASERATRASDIYSLGVLIFEMLTSIDVSAVSSRRLGLIGGARNRPGRPSQHARVVDRALDELVLRALAEDPSARYASAADFRDALQRYLNRRFPRFRADDETLRLARQHAGHKVGRLFSLIERWRTNVRHSSIRARAEAGPRTSLRAVESEDLSPSAALLPTIDLRSAEPTEDLAEQRAHEDGRAEASETSGPTAVTSLNASRKSTGAAAARPAPGPSAVMPREAALAEPAPSLGLLRASTEGPRTEETRGFLPRTDDLARDRTQDLARPGDRRTLRVTMVVLLLLLGVAAATLYAHLSLPEGRVTLEKWSQLLHLTN